MWELIMKPLRVLVALIFLFLPVSQAMADDLEDQSHLVEIGVFGGVMLPSEEHELVELGVKEHQTFDDVLPDIGLRIGYLPIPYLGIEAEGAIIPATTTGGDDGTIYSVRGHLLGQYPIGRVAPFLVAGGGMMGISSDALGDDIDGLSYWGVGVKYYPLDWLNLRLEGRHDLSAGTVGTGDNITSHFEVLASITGVIGWEKADKDKDGIADEDDKCPAVAGVEPDGCPPDTDADGILDADDKCPEEYAKTADGCPVLDEDGDGVADANDKCLGRVGVAPDGCPPDSDGDGLLDDEDSCPKEAAKTKDGCPIPDSDGDGILDDTDQCKDKAETQNGYQDSDGCPDEVPEIVKQFTGDIKGINFETNSDEIRKGSFKVLDKAVKVLKDYPEVKLTIRGHTDSRGDKDHNIDLSARRAKSVKAYMVEKGIDAGRLSTVGVGPREPIADNETKKGRAENRRIEFSIR